MNPPYQPNGEMAGVGWIKSIPGVDATKVAATVPGDPSKWNTTGFITVTSVGGSSVRSVNLRRPVIQISCWTVSINSEKAPWGEAFALAEHVRSAFFNRSLFPARFTWPSYLPAVVQSGYPLTDPRKIPGSAAGYAHVQFDATLAWTAVEGE